MADKLLSGLQALDLTDEKGFVCGKILAAMGVDTIKIERPGGDPARSIPPFYHDTPDPEKSLYWFAFNTDKRSITLNLETDQGKDLFRKLAVKADFVLESFSPGFMDVLGLGYEALCRINPRIIMTSITPFGQKGPHSYFKGSELVVSAMSGVLVSTGDPDRAPVMEAPGSIYFRAGAAAACWTVISHYYREITGEGQQVDVSIQEVDASRHSVNLYMWEFDKRLFKRKGPMRQFGFHPIRSVYPCKDGYVCWILWGGAGAASRNSAISQWIDEEGLENPLRQVTNWKEFDMAAIAKETVDAFEVVIGKLFLKHTKKEIAEEGLKRGIEARVVSNPADVCKDPQLRARSFWVDLGHPELGVTLAYPKHFFLCSETENYVRRRAPLIGEDNDEIYGKELGLSSTEIAELKEANVI
jgi:crotonobetainyl-CoA:carnitine CoA-transferase CaiB-like acyl-CoA transferase